MSRFLSMEILTTQCLRRSLVRLFKHSRVKQKNIMWHNISRQNNSSDQFIEYFNDTIKKLTSTGKTFCIMGDFNLRLLKKESSSYNSYNTARISYCPCRVFIFFQLLTNQHAYVITQPLSLTISSSIILTKF